MPDVRTPSVHRSHDPRKRGGERGLEVSLGGLGQNHLVQGKVGNSTPKPGILRLQFLQPLYLVALQTAVLRPPPVVCNFRHAYLPDRFRHRFSLCIQHVNLTELRDALFCLVSFRCHFNVLLRRKSHTS